MLNSDMNTFSIIRVGRLAFILIAIQASAVAWSDDVMSNAQAVEFLAAMTASGEVCAARYPSLRKGVDAWWDNLTGPTGEWAKRTRQTPEFAEALAKARTDSQVVDVTEEQCKSAFK